MKKTPLKLHVHHSPSKKRKVTTGVRTIDDYIESESRLVTAAKLKQLALLRANMTAKLRLPQAVRQFEFQQQALLLVKFLGSDDVRFSRDPLPGHLSEAAVAANYLLKGIDLIPDEVPEIGLADDAIIVGRVFSRNPELGQLLKEQ